jgi:hypothetical protein
MFAQDITTRMAHLHSLNILHHDLTSKNILVLLLFFPSLPLLLLSLFFSLLFYYGKLTKYSYKDTGCPMPYIPYIFLLPFFFF